MGDDDAAAFRRTHCRRGDNLQRCNIILAEISQTFPVPKQLQIFAPPVCQRKILPAPSFCPPFVDQLMDSCFSIDPRERPTFDEIFKFLKKMKKWFDEDDETADE